MTDAASWKAVERKARLAGNGRSPLQGLQHRIGSSGTLCIRHYYLDRVLAPCKLSGGARDTHLFSNLVYTTPYPCLYGTHGTSFAPCNLCRCQSLVVNEQNVTALFLADVLHTGHQITQAVSYLCHAAYVLLDHGYRCRFAVFVFRSILRLSQHIQCLVA